MLTYALAAFVATTVAQEFARGVRARRALHGEPAAAALGNLFRRSGRRYGGYVVHLGIVLVALGIATSEARTVTEEGTLAPGGSLAVAGYRVRLDELRRVSEPQRQRVVAELAVERDGWSETLPAAIVFYPNATAGIGSPGIRAGLGDDVYAILMAYDARGMSWATIQVRVIPLISWLWIGGAVVGLGAVVAALPPPRRRERALPAVVLADARAEAP